MTLKQWRRAKDISEDEMAEKLGVHRATIRRWESGYKMPVKSAIRYCELLDININDVEFNI